MSPLRPDDLCLCGHERAWHTGCGPGHHEGSPHESCCDGDQRRCACHGFELARPSHVETRSER